MCRSKKKALEIFKDLLYRYPQLNGCSTQIQDAYVRLRELYEHDGCLFAAGNGGSAADCEHIVGELMKSFLFKRKIQDHLQIQMQEMYGDEAGRLCRGLEGGLAAISLPSLVSLGTAIINDMDKDMIYAQMICAVGKESDVFLGISTSGNSDNIIHAMMTAKAKKMICIGLTGKETCRMDGLADVVVHVPETETYKVQELHLPVYHALCAMIETVFFECA